MAGTTKSWRNKRDAIVARDGPACWICGGVPRPELVTLDHIIPRVKGGSARVSNLRLACRFCNGARGSTDAGQAVRVVQAARERVELKEKQKRKRGWRWVPAELMPGCATPAGPGSPVPFEEALARQKQDEEARIEEETRRRLSTCRAAADDDSEGYAG